MAFLSWIFFKNAFIYGKSPVFPVKLMCSSSKKKKSEYKEREYLVLLLRLLLNVSTARTPTKQFIDADRARREGFRYILQGFSATLRIPLYAIHQVSLQLQNIRTMKA